MTAPEADAEPASPRTTHALLGHAATEAALLAAYRGGRVPHAFMLVGEKGIGKATLAYRMARFVLANPDPAAAQSARGNVARARSGSPGSKARGGAGARRSPRPRANA